MFTNLYTLFLIFIFCEAATKIGLGNGRPSEEPSSLKTEIMKFKTSECGGSSYEEDGHSRNKKQKNRRRKDSNEDDDDEDSKEDKKKKNSRGKNNNGRMGSRGHREELISGYGSTSYEDIRIFGTNRRPEEDYDYMNRRDPFQNRWYDTHQTSRPNSYNPYGGTADEVFYPNKNNNNRRPNIPNNHNNRNQETYNSRPGTAYPSHDRDDERYYNRDDRYSNRDRNRDSHKDRDRDSHRDRDRHSHKDRDRDSHRDRDRDSNMDRDRNSSRSGKRKHGHNWNESQEDESRNSGRRSGSRKSSSRGKGNKNVSSDGECISQCVFNNMEIMEDDGIPSEAGMIKWAQDKIKNEKLKQTAIKEIRKCFGTLASSDGENSCNFSKSLAQCLKLNLDDDKD